MSTISLTNASTPFGILGKVFAQVAGAWNKRRAAAAFAGMSEREYQDIGWGQADRHSHVLSLRETPPERSARAAAVQAWHRSGRKAA